MKRIIKYIIYIDVSKLNNLGADYWSSLSSDENWI